MKIVVLDGHALNPGDLSWEALASQGELTVHPRTPPEKVIERSLGAEIIFTNKTVLSAEILRELTDLRFIGVLATGVDVVDLAAAREQGVVVTNVPVYGTAAVAQATIAHLLNLTNRTALHAEDVSAGGWSRADDFCYCLTPQIELAGQVFGLIGAGRIGQAVADIARAFGMTTITHDPHASNLPPELEAVDLDTLLARSDVLSLHCPATAENRHLINRETLGKMKPGAMLINTSRGALIDGVALAQALNADRLAGAGLDVLESEPPSPDNPLLTAKNCFVTPHIAWAARAARERLMAVAASNLEAFLAGTPENQVN